METKKRYRARGTGSLRRYKGSRVWWLHYYVAGRRVNESSHTAIKQQAILLLQRRIGEAERGEQPAADLRKLAYENVRQALIDHYAVEERRSRLKDGRPNWGSLKALDAFFSGRTVAEINTGLIRRYILARKKDGVSPATINRSLTLLHRILSLAMADGRLLRMPKFPRLREAAPRRGFVTYEQFQRLLEALPGHLRPLVMLLFWSGIRIGEARKIDWTQVDLDNREIILEGHQAKSGQARIIPMPDELVALLRDQSNKTGPVFHQGEFRRAWATACHKVGLGHRTKEKGSAKFPKFKGTLVHDLRRSAIRNFREAGVAQSTIMAISGHKTESVFRRYSINSREDLHRAMQRVQGASKVVDLEASNGESLGSVEVNNPHNLLMGL